MPFTNLKRRLSIKRKSNDKSLSKERLIPQNDQEDHTSSSGAYTRFSLVSQSGKIDTGIPGSSDKKCVIDKEHLCRDNAISSIVLSLRA